MGEQLEGSPHCNLLMGFTKNVVIVFFSLVVTFLVVWWSGLLEDFGFSGPLDFIGTFVSFLPAWLWAIIGLFVAGGIGIERLFNST